MVLMDEQLGAFNRTGRLLPPQRQRYLSSTISKRPKTTKGRYKSDLSMYDIGG